MNGVSGTDDTDNTKFYFFPSVKRCILCGEFLIFNF